MKNFISLYLKRGLLHCFIILLKHSLEYLSVENCLISWLSKEKRHVWKQNLLAYWEVFLLSILWLIHLIYTSAMPLWEHLVFFAEFTIPIYLRLCLMW